MKEFFNIFYYFDNNNSAFFIKFSKLSSLLSNFGIIFSTSFLVYPKTCNAEISSSMFWFWLITAFNSSLESSSTSIVFNLSLSF